MLDPRPVPARISLRDAALIAQLEAAFDIHAGADGVIDAKDLMRALGLQSEYLASRVLAAFDSDGNGRVDRREFLGGLKRLVASSERDKLEFAFRLHDSDGDGFIGQTELLRMIFLGLAEDQVITDEGEPERLAAALWAQADQNRDGRISFEEFQAVVRRRPTLLASMTRSEATWISPNEALLERLAAAKPNRAERLARSLQNRWRELLMLGLVLLAHAVVLGFALRPSSYVPDERLAVRLTRGLGQLLSLDLGFLFLAVTRRLLTRVRASRLGAVLPVDSAVDFHRWLGYALLACSLAHTWSALRARAQGHPGLLLTWMFESERGLTGLLALLVLLGMAAFALPFFRRTQRFELFYYSHLGYALFTLLVLLHAPTSLALAGLPLLLFLVERSWRQRVRKARVAIVRVDSLRSGVTRLELERPPGFAQSAGDYAFVNLPAIAEHEWHPFTISSAPEQDNLVFHVRSLGNFTAALRAWAETRAGAGTDLGYAQLDGPYGSPSAHIFKARHAVLIGAGIGVTPFASLLESILWRAEHGDEPLQLEKVHFYWLNRDAYSFEWFAELLARLEGMKRRDLLDLHIHMTGGHGGTAVLGLEIARRMHAEGGAPDVVTGLRALTRMGHPDWERELSAIAARHAPEPVAVFFCGPAGLARKIARICEQKGLRFHEERF